MMKKALLSLLLAFVCLPTVFAQTNPGLSIQIDTVASCQDYTWPRNNQTYTHDTVVMLTIDDTAFVLTFSKLNISIDTTTPIMLMGECSAILNGRVFTTNGTFLDTLTSVSGCDSIVKVNVVLANIDTVKSVAACGSYTAPWGMVYTESRVIDTVIVSDECTYHNVINLTVNPEYSNIQIDTVAECTFQWGNTVISDTAMHTFLLKTVEGNCDSIIKIHVTAFSGQQFDTLSMVACDSYKPSWAASAFTTSGLYNHDTAYGTYYVNPTTSLPCTHHEVLDLTIVNSISDSATVTPTSVTAGCSYTWGGMTITDTNVHYHLFTSAIGGCDSLVAVKVTYTNTNYDTTFARICGDTYNWKASCPSLPLPGTNADYAYTTDTTVSVQVIDTVTGCTNIYVLQLNFISQKDTSTQYYCGEYYDYTYDVLRMRPSDGAMVWQKATARFSTSGYHQVADNGDTLYSRNIVTHCLTAITLNLNLNVPETLVRETSIDTAACEEFSFRIGNSRPYKVTADCTDSIFVYQNRIQVAGESCFDSLVHVTVVINHNSFIERTATECDSYVWSEFDGNTYTTSGVYRDTLSERTSEGCLQIGRLSLTIHKTPTVNIVGDWMLEPGESTTLKAEVEPGSDNISSYKWYVNNSMRSTSDSLVLENVMSNTDVRLEATSIHNCVATNWLTVTSNVGIDGVEDLHVNVYPNPASRYLNIECAERMAEVVIYNTVGQQVVSQIANGNNMSLDLGNLATGTYTLRITDVDGNQTTRKFIVNK